MDVRLCWTQHGLRALQSLVLPGLLLRPATLVEGEVALSLDPPLRALVSHVAALAAAAVRLGSGSAQL